jgi:hypothetical protein
MATVKGMYRRGEVWWFRYTPGPGQPQRRESLDTTIESVAAAMAVQIKTKAALERPDEFSVELERYFADQIAKGLISAEGARNRRWVFARFVQSFAVKKISDVTRDVVERWIGKLREGERGRRDKRIEVRSVMERFRATCSISARFSGG